VSYSVLQCVAVCCSELQCVVQCVAVSCSELQCVAVGYMSCSGVPICRQYCLLACHDSFFA